MLSGQKLHLSRLFRVAVLCVMPAFAAQSFAQFAPLGRPDPDNLFPRPQAQAELVSIFDMRQDHSGPDRVFAQSLEGLANIEPVRRDKIFVILNDQDAEQVQFLIHEQWVLSASHIDSMDALLLREPVRDAILFDRASTGIAPALAGCEHALLVADPKLIETYHLTIKEDLRGKFKSADEACMWLLEKYPDEVNHKIVSLSGSLNLVDYQVANRIIGLPTETLGSDEIQNDLVTKFDANVPCLGNIPGGQPGQTIIDDLSRAGKFLVPTDNLNNLSMLSSFPPANGEFSEQASSGAVHQPRALHGVDPDTGFPTQMEPDPRPWVQAPLGFILSKQLDPLLMQLAPPLGPKFLDRSQTYKLGFISEDEYGKSYGTDRNRVWADYQWLSNQVQRQAH